MVEQDGGSGDLFARALDEAMADSGLSLAAVCRRLEEQGAPVSPAALAAWRSGVRRPEHTRSLDALDVLEELFDLPRGHLVSRLGPTRRTRPDRVEEFAELVGSAGPFTEQERALGFDGPMALEAVAASTTVDVAPTLRDWSLTYETHWRARRSGAARIRVPLLLENPAGEPELTALLGSQVGRHRWDPASGAATWELMLDHPLDVGETTVTRHRIDIGESRRLTNFWAMVERRTILSALSVQWHGAVPRHLELHRETDAGVVVKVLPVVGRSAHRIESQFGPGAFGFEWEW